MPDDPFLLTDADCPQALSQAARFSMCQTDGPTSTSTSKEDKIPAKGRNSLVTVGTTGGLPLRLAGPSSLRPPSLRPYQFEAIAALRDAVLRGHRRPLLVLPTGAGKTVVAGEIIRSAVAKGGRVLFLAPRRELIFQASAKLDDAGVLHGVILADANERDGISAAVHVAGIDTVLARAVRSDRLTLPDYGLIIVDEAHLAATEARQRLLDRWPDAVRLGLTATPCRKDGKALGAIFDEIVDPAPVARLTAEGYLVPARYFTPIEPDLAGVRTIGGDWHGGDLEAAVNKPQLVGDIVEHWLAHAGGRRTVIFGTSIAHAVALADEFQRHGAAAESVDANTPQADRDAVFHRFREGRTQVLTNCMLASLGFDLPAISCVVIARPTKSLALYLQMIGRGLRPSEGKSDCLILDHAGCVHRHGFADEPRVWTLSGNHALASGQSGGKEAGEARQITCPECRCVFERSRACPECGHELRPLGKAVETLPGRLVALNGGGATGVDRLVWYRQVRRIGEENGYSLGWSSHQFKAKFGVFPPRSWSRHTSVPADFEVRRWVKSRQIAWAKARARKKGVAHARR